MYQVFLQHFFRNPKKVGALVPLSKKVAGQLSQDLKVRADHKPWLILEAGAGIGNVSQEILKWMKENDRLDIIEIDPTFCAILKETFKEDRRVTIHCLSILDWKPKDCYDFIVSTLPLNSFAPNFVEKVFKHYQEISKPDARFTYVEYIGLEKVKWLFSNSKNRKISQNRKQFLANFHKTHLLNTDRVYANFLPCYIYHLTLHP